MSTHNESRIDFVVRKLREVMPKNWPEVSRRSGVPEKTIYKIAYRTTKDPRSSTLDALYEYFQVSSDRPKRRATDKPAKS